MARDGADRLCVVIRVLIIVVLAVAVFGSGAYWTYELFLKPGRELKAERTSGVALPALPDPSIPEFEKCLALRKQLRAVEARDAFALFLEQYPASTKLEDAMRQLGELNVSLFLSPVAGPGKEMYVVKSGDVITRVASKQKTSPELIMRVNRLPGSMLRVGQRLTIVHGAFSLVLDKPRARVVLLKDGKFFKRYEVRSGAGGASAAAKKGGAQAGARVSAKVTDKMAWSTAGQRVTFADKDYLEALHWVQVGGTTLYADEEPKEGRPVPRGAHGLALAARDMEELAALLRKGDPVTILP